MNKTASLTPAVKRIICDKATEYPNSGNYDETNRQGTYLCRRCGLALFRGNNQFQSGCGWPSFDDAIPSAVKQQLDADGSREEILCQRCDAHLGHVFVGEHLTLKNIRHCVNAASLDFVESTTVLDTEEAIVAGGCFWGVEYLYKQLPGVLKAEVGYIGGSIPNPTYSIICSNTSGHYEAARVVFDTAVTDYESIIKYFFELHDPSQANGQGPDIGQQYQSAIFYYDATQKSIAENLIKILSNKGYSVATRLFTMQPFWAAEAYHQQYYEKNHKAPYCHRRTKRF